MQLPTNHRQFQRSGGPAGDAGLFTIECARGREKGRKTGALLAQVTRADTHTHSLTFSADGSTSKRSWNPVGSLALVLQQMKANLINSSAV